MFKLKIDFTNGAVALPTDLIDKYLKLAPSASFKVLLFILRNPNSSQDAKQISICTGLSEDDVKDCIDYWTSQNIVFDDGKTDEEKAKEAFGNVKRINEISKEEKTESSPKIIVKSLPVKKPTANEIALRLSEDENLTLLYREAQKIVGTFGYDTQSLLLMIYDHFGFSVDLIITLLSFQKKEGNLSSAAIKRRAEDWVKKGIDSLEAAIGEISALEKIQKTYIEIKAIIKTENEKPTPKTSEYLRNWVVNWGFSTEMIFYALNETGNSFSEANKLLKKWYSAGLFTVEEVKAKNKKFVSKKIEKSYDITNIGRNSVLERMKNKEKEGANV